jgi:hypothetical protein
MTPSNRRAAARLISHVLVGGAATLLAKQVLGRRAGLGARLLTGAAAAALHQRLDAPVANALLTVL